MKNLKFKILNLKLFYRIPQCNNMRIPHGHTDYRLDARPCASTIAHCSLLTAFCLLLTATSFADVKIQGSPTIYTTIQSAVNAAVDGNKLLVSTGLYLESVSITNKFIELEGGYLSPAFTTRTNDNSLTIIGTNIIGSVVNTIIYNNQAFSGGNKCIPDNPMFVSPGDDYTLLSGSPCIDVGYNMVWMNPPETDLEGDERIYDGIVDIGCYEFIPEPFCLSFIIYYVIFIKFRFKLRL